MRVARLIRHLFGSWSGFLLLVLVVTSSSVAYGNYMQRSLRQETQRVVDTLMLELLTRWNQQAFLNHASSNLQQQMRGSQLQKVDSVFYQLGGLARYYGSSGHLVRIGSMWWWSLAAQYQIRATFEHGELLATVILVKEEDVWVIDRFFYEYAVIPNTQRALQVI
jgi:hypothetical protein